MKRNIYDLVNDYSEEAEGIINKWASYGKLYYYRPPRERLALMINTLEGEDIVRDYLNTVSSNWEFTDSERYIINTEYRPKKARPDLWNSKTKILCEIKEVPDYMFQEDPTFKFLYSGDYRYLFHYTENVIVINRSHTKIAQLDMNTLKLDEKYVYIQPLKIIKLRSKSWEK